MSEELKGTLKPMTVKERKALAALGYTNQKDVKGLTLEQRTKIIKEQIRNPNFVKPSEQEIGRLNKRISGYNENIDNYVLQLQKKFPKINKDILQQAFDSGNPKEFLAKHPVTKHLTYGSTQRLGERGLLSDVPILDLVIPKSTFDIDSKIFKNFKNINRSNATLEKYDIKDPSTNNKSKVPVLFKTNQTIDFSSISNPQNREIAKSLHKQLDETKASIVGEYFT